MDKEGGSLLLCQYCKQRGARFSCTRCLRAVYCCASCQRRDWRARHQYECEHTAAVGGLFEDLQNIWSKYTSEGGAFVVIFKKRLADDRTAASLGFVAADGSVRYENLRRAIASCDLSTDGKYFEWILNSYVNYGFATLADVLSKTRPVLFRVERLNKILKRSKEPEIDVFAYCGLSGCASTLGLAEVLRTKHILLEENAFGILVYSDNMVEIRRVHTDDVYMHYRYNTLPSTYDLSQTSFYAVEQRGPFYIMATLSLDQPAAFYRIHLHTGTFVDNKGLPITLNAYFALKKSIVKFFDDRAVSGIDPKGDQNLINVFADVISFGKPWDESKLVPESPVKDALSRISWNENNKNRKHVFVDLMLSIGLNPNASRVIHYFFTSSSSSSSSSQSNVKQAIDISHPQTSTLPTETRKIPLIHSATGRWTLELMLKCGAKVNARDSLSGKTRFFFETDVNIARFLLLNKGDLSIRDNDYQTALHAAQDIDVLALYVGFAPNLISAKDKNGRTPFHVVNSAVEVKILASVERDKTSVAASFLAINSRDNEGRTPLVYLSERTIDNLDMLYSIAEALLAEGADPRIGDNKGNTALHAHINMSYVALMLLDCCADLLGAKNHDGQTPLHLLTSVEAADSIARYIRGKRISLKIDEPDNAGETALFLSVKRNNHNMIDFWLRIGANVNASNKQGQTPVFMVKDIYSLYLLRKHKKVDVNHQDNEGRTALHVQKNTNIISSLLAYGANPRLADNKGNLPDLGPALDTDINILKTTSKQ